MIRPFFAPLTVAVVLCCVLAPRACNAEDSASDEGSDAKCTFSVDGSSFTGRASTQEFPATKEFSVLCQDSSDVGKLIQIVFRDEASARVSQKFKLVRDKATSAANADEASVTFDNSYESSDSSAGAVSVKKDGSGNVVSFDDVNVADMTKASVRVSGTIPF